MLGFNDRVLIHSVTAKPDRYPEIQRGIYTNERVNDLDELNTIRTSSTIYYLLTYLRLILSTVIKRLGVKCQFSGIG